MGLPVRIDDQLYEQAKAHAQAERRTIAEQLEFWAMVRISDVAPAQDGDFTNT